MTAPMDDALAGPRPVFFAAPVTAERRVSRDEFALAAMAALIAHPQSISPSGNEAAYAAGSYAIADAMIAERDKKAGG